MGNVVSAGLGQNIARQCAIDGGLPTSVGALTVNKVCGSGMQTVIMGAEALAGFDRGAGRVLPGRPYRIAMRVLTNVEALRRGGLEGAIDACEDAANVIERIVVKHA